MSTRMRRSAVRALLLAVIAAGTSITVADSASAYVTSDLNDFNLTTTLSVYATSYHISTGTDGAVSYRWLDSPSHSTWVAALTCSDNSLLGQWAFYPVADTSYSGLFSGVAGACFQVAGETTSGTMSLYDGRVER